jgi:hypothetical protein
MHKAANIFWLGTKELRSFSRDFVIVAFLIWSFSFDVLNRAHGHLQEVYNASVAVIDEDQSELSHRIISAFLPPQFKSPVAISERDIDHAMNIGAFTFVIDIPPYFERDVLAGRRPRLQLMVAREFTLREILARFELKELRTWLPVVQPNQHVALGNGATLAVADFDNALPYHARDLGPADRLDIASRINDLGCGSTRRRGRANRGTAP